MAESDLAEMSQYNKEKLKKTNFKIDECVTLECPCIFSLANKVAH